MAAASRMNHSLGTDCHSPAVTDDSVAIVTSQDEKQEDATGEFISHQASTTSSEDGEGIGGGGSVQRLTFKADWKLLQLTKKKKLSRNESEKLRRDRLNCYIAELATLVPLVSNTDHKIDKASILRLTVAYFRIYNDLVHARRMSRLSVSWRSDLQTFSSLGTQLFDAIGGFMIAISSKGMLLFATEALTKHLGHRLSDVLGFKVQNLIHPKDIQVLMQQFAARGGDWRGGDSKGGENMEDDAGDGHRSFYVKMLNVLDQRSTCYELVHIMAHLRRRSTTGFDDLTSPSVSSSTVPSTPTQTGSDTYLIGVARLIKNGHPTLEPRPPDPLSANQWITRHDIDGKITFSHQRGALLTGFMPRESIGFSPYSLIYPDDIAQIAAVHNIYLRTRSLPCTVFRMYTKSRDVIHIRNKTHMVTDPWTHKPRFIININEVLSDEHGAHALEEQDRFVQKASAALLHSPSPTNPALLSSPPNDQSCSNPSISSSSSSISISSDLATSCDVQSPWSSASSHLTPAIPSPAPTAPTAPPSIAYIDSSTVHVTCHSRTFVIDLVRDAATDDDVMLQPRDPCNIDAVFSSAAGDETPDEPGRPVPSVEPVFLGDSEAAPVCGSTSGAGGLDFPIPESSSSSEKPGVGNSRSVGGSFFTGAKRGAVVLERSSTTNGNGLGAENNMASSLERDGTVGFATNLVKVYEGCVGDANGSIENMRSNGVATSLREVKGLAGGDARRLSLEDCRQKEGRRCQLKDLLTAGHRVGAISSNGSTKNGASVTGGCGDQYAAYEDGLLNHGEVSIVAQLKGCAAAAAAQRNIESDSTKSNCFPAADPSFLLRHLSNPSLESRQQSSGSRKRSWRATEWNDTRASTETMHITSATQQYTRQIDDGNATQFLRSDYPRGSTESCSNSTSFYVSARHVDCTEGSSNLRNRMMEPQNGHHLSRVSSSSLASPQKLGVNGSYPSSLDKYLSSTERDVDCLSNSMVAHNTHVHRGPRSGHDFGQTDAAQAVQSSGFSQRRSASFGASQNFKMAACEANKTMVFQSEDATYGSIGQWPSKSGEQCDTHVSVDVYDSSKANSCDSQVVGITEDMTLTDLDALTAAGALVTDYPESDVDGSCCLQPFDARWNGRNAFLNNTEIMDYTNNDNSLSDYFVSNSRCVDRSTANEQREAVGEERKRIPSTQSIDVFHAGVDSGQVVGCVTNGSARFDPRISDVFLNACPMNDAANFDLLDPASAEWLFGISGSNF